MVPRRWGSERGKLRIKQVDRVKFREFPQQRDFDSGVSSIRP